MLSSMYPEEGRKQGAPLFARGFSQPAINAVQTMSLMCGTRIRCLRCNRRFFWVFRSDQVVHQNKRLPVDCYSH